MKTSVLIEKRAELGLTLDEAASRCGLSKEGYRRIEAGKNRPQAQTIRKLSDGLGIPILDLVDAVEQTRSDLAEIVPILRDQIERLQRQLDARQSTRQNLNSET